MNYKIYKIEVYPRAFFTSPVSSYTLFGALSWARKLLYGEENLKKFLEKSKKEPEFILSDFLPTDKNGNLYYSKPLLKPRREKCKVDTTKLKKFKGTKYIPEKLFFEVLEGKIKDDFELYEKWKSLGSEINNIFEEFIIPHTQINRLTYESNYYNDFAFTSEKFFFFVAVRDENILNDLKPLFKLLEDIGIGGNKSIGFGRVNFTEPRRYEKLEKYFNSKKERFITLSSFIPEANTYDLENSYYDYFTFRGAIDNSYLDYENINIWKNKVFYLLSGSNLKVKNKEKNFYGQLKEVFKINNEEPIYQYGYAFPLYF